jgi:ATP-dependent HslUV protease ATP-binding subunit HslU
LEQSLVLSGVENDLSQTLTPSKIVEALDQYIIGQKEAKKAVAIALRNRWRRLNAPEHIRKEIMPNNILMIGSTGVGKTEIARRLAQLAEAPFIKVEASKFTEVGYVGRDVESMVRDLLEYSISMVKAKHKEECLVKAQELADEEILDILIPPIKSNAETNNHTGFIKPEATQADIELNERTREKFRIKLKNGELDDRHIELDMKIGSGPSVQVLGPAGFQGIEGLSDLLSNLTPVKKKKTKLTVKEAREYLIEEEAQKLIDMEAVTRQAIEKTEQSGIIFIDEIDKIASNTTNRSGADVSREGVQRDLLPVIEGTVVNTKYGAVKTDHVLFIAAGAFHLSKPSDLIPELQGRLPIRVELSALTEEDFVNILTRPQNALTKQYQALLESEGIELHFEEDAIKEIARIAFQVNQEIENIGARRLHTIMSNLLDQILFEVPDLTDKRSFVITANDVQDKLNAIVKSRDLSRYIL